MITIHFIPVLSKDAVCCTSFVKILIDAFFFFLMSQLNRKILHKRTNITIEVNYNAQSNI